MSQLARIKENIDWRNENIQKETYATHLAFDSIEQIIESEETEINDCILDNITADEKFKIICRTKNIDIQEMAIDIYKIIENSDLGEKSDYLSICEYQDEYMDVYNVYQLYIYSDMLYTFDEWAKAHMKDYDVSYDECKYLEWELYIIEQEFSEEQKDFIKLALKCGVDSIVIKEMP